MNSREIPGIQSLRNERVSPAVSGGGPMKKGTKTMDQYAGKTKKKYGKLRMQEAVIGWIFVLPAILFWLVWFLYPAVKAISISFYQYNYATPETNAFVGISNYIRLFHDPKFFAAMRHSFLMVLIIVPLQSLLSFSIAVLLNGKIRMKGFFRSSCYIPYVISAMAVTIFFMYFFVKNGPAARFFTLFGLENVSWFTSTKYAMAFLIIVYIWQQVGFYMVIFIGGLQEVPIELYEAAKVDGANAWQRLVKITIPLIKNTTYLVLTFGMINALQIFDQIAAMSKQSPLGSPSGATSTMVTFLYQQSFSYMDMGYGSAAAVILFLIIFALSAVREMAGKRSDE